MDDLKPGSVVQITDDTPGRKGWYGAFLLVTEVKPWGVQGFVHCIQSHDVMTAAYVRLPHGKFELIGQAKLMHEEIEGS